LEVEDRFIDLTMDPNRLYDTNPFGYQDSYQGHRHTYERRRTELRDAVDVFSGKGCDDPGDGEGGSFLAVPRLWIGVPAPTQPDRRAQPGIVGPDPETAAILAGAATAAYIAYRIIRLVPSLAVPVTIPLNLAIP
jgi:hypothetical protein